MFIDIDAFRSCLIRIRIVAGRPRGTAGVRAFERRFRLPFRAQPDAVSAKLSGGILELSLPRMEAERPRKIEIEQA